jgi:hypothetical protein
MFSRFESSFPRFASCNPSIVERDCQNWKAEATKVFVEGTEIGDLIRSEVPTSSDYNPPTPAPPPPPTPPTP